MNLTQTVAIVVVVAFSVVIICALALVAYAAREYTPPSVEVYPAPVYPRARPTEDTTEQPTLVTPSMYQEPDKP